MMSFIYNRVLAIGSQWIVTILQFLVQSFHRIHRRSSEGQKCSRNWLEKLPIEIILQIANNNLDTHTLSSLTKVNSTHRAIFIDVLHKRGQKGTRAAYALICAALTRDFAFLEAVLQEAKSLSVRPGTETLIHGGLESYSMGTCELISANVANLFIIYTFEDDPIEWPVLHMCAAYGHDRIVQMLLEKGANISAYSNYGWTALHYAACSGNAAVINTLIDNGADIRTRTRDSDDTPLEVAISSRSVSLVKCILRVSDPTSICYFDGMLPLHVASFLRGDNTDLVKFLLDNGASISSTDHHGCTALTYAARYGNQNVFQLLADHGALVTSEMLDDCIQGNLYEDFFDDVNARRFVQRLMLQKIVENAPNNLRGPYNKTPLRIAVEQLDVSFVSRLILKGADVNSKASDQSSPLHAAAFIGNLDIVRELLDNGADVNAKNRHKLTPLDAAVDPLFFASFPSRDFTYGASVKVVELLIDTALERSPEYFLYVTKVHRKYAGKTFVHSSILQCLAEKCHKPEE